MGGTDNHLNSPGVVFRLTLIRLMSISSDSGMNQNKEL